MLLFTFGPGLALCCCAFGRSHGGTLETVVHSANVSYGLKELVRLTDLGARAPIIPGAHPSVAADRDTKKKILDKEANDAIDPMFLCVTFRSSFIAFGKRVSLYMKYLLTATSLIE